MKLVIAALAAAAVLLAPATAQSRRSRASIEPYIDASQVLVADLSGSDEVLTYSTIGAGVDASIQSRRVEVQLSYKYERRFDYQRDVADQDTHSGLARAAVRVARGVTVEGGALATRARADQRGDAPGNLVGNVRNTSQVYSGYAGVTAHSGNGPASVSAAYRLGATKVEAPAIVGVSPAAPPVDLYDRAVSHIAQVRAGVKAGAHLPIGVSVAGAWQREEASQLDQTYDGKFARADAVLPVGGDLAVVGGVGYEQIEITQKDALRDANGNVVRDGADRFVTDEASAPRIAYETDGIFWDAGVMYKAARLMLEARAGRRYDSMSYTGSLQWQISRRSALQIGVYDSVESFGRQLASNLAALPTRFGVPVDPFGDAFNGCVFSAAGQNAGQCLDNALSSIAAANYRARGVTGVLALNAGPTSFGFGAGYANRRYLVPAGSSVLAGTSDETWFAQAFASRQLDPQSTLTGNLYANYFVSGIPGSPTVLGAGANGSYIRSFGPLSATASLGIYTFDVEGQTGNTSAQALLGLRYGF
ncbi:hypothetical protein [Sphingomonas turrisvirgatae]|uniref:Preprotein translocase subunit YajC n=1 Tax=Sphingomonas turrisvirgatae TaxID=1888892 RepID=A0A1E3LSU6_9SPHN|nr:hypothetical protein [Sphingomonas turrisvirgatae]ODP36841.1 hypothetical protein BFL28_03780 [Sphingomonas turrisvirgatae]